MSGAIDFTIECWVYLINGGHGSTWSRILHIGSGNTTGALHICCYNAENPGRLLMSIWTPTEINIGITPTLNNNQWYHIAVTRQGNNWYTFYDGINCSYSVKSLFCKRPLTALNSLEP